jgi:hypothetical protein
LGQSIFNFQIMPRKKVAPADPEGLQLSEIKDAPSPSPLEPKEEKVRPTPRRKPSKVKEEPVEFPALATPEPILSAEPAVAEVKPKAARPKRKPAAVPATVDLPLVQDAKSDVEIAPASKPKRSRKRVQELESIPAGHEPGIHEVTDPDGSMQISFRPLSVQVTGKGKERSVVAPVESEPEAVENLDPEAEIMVLEWRSKPAGPSNAKAPSPEPERPARASQKKGARTRKGKEPIVDVKFDDSFAEEEFETDPAVAATSAPEPVRKPVPTPIETPKKLAIPIPTNAPQVVVKQGVPQFVREHRVYPPLIFFGNASDERRAETVFEELGMAAEAGIHLHSFLVELTVDPKQVDHSAGIAGYLLSTALKVDPEAQVIFRLEFQSPRGWEDKYPDALYQTDGGDIAEPSVCDEKYWKVAENCLALFVKKILLLEGADHVFGLHLERGEWFQSADHGFDNSKSATRQFRNWAKRRYLNDEVTLRASWFDGSVRFDSITIPPYNPETVDGDHFIRSSRKQRKYVDYHLFLSDETVSRISDLAYVAKEASGGMLAIGVSYGYTFEWSHPASGHLALGKLLRTDEIDFIAGPPSYRNRGTGGSAPFPCPIDSFALNGKLYISEEDFKTSLSRGHEPDDFNPPLRTPQALESVHWRGAGAALAHASGVEWMDLWGNGWLKTHSVWERAGSIRNALINRMEAPLADPDVAVFIDERALAYLVDSNAFNLLVQSVRESILRAGVSAGFYLLSDLQHREKFPESKLYLFLNAWDIRPELRAAIKSRLQRDHKVLFWLYSAGLFDAGRESLERAREVTGIALKPQPFHSLAGTTILNRRHPLVEAFPERSLVGAAKMEPSYFAIPEDGVVLGEYTQTGLPSLVVKEFREDPSAIWTSVFLGEPVVNPALIRALAQMAGAHVWNFHEDVVHVRGQFCTIHCSSTGPRTVTLPNRSCAYNVLTRDWVAIDATSLKFYGIDGSTHVFLVGQKGEIENFLDQDPESVLRIETLPVRESNIRVDTANFDVPIMKLDEWMEGGDQDEVADEWFLRPQALLKESESVTGQAEESPEEVGKRRRKRKRTRGGDDGEFERPDPRQTGSTTVTIDTEDSFTMNVVFRTRD